MYYGRYAGHCWRSRNELIRDVLLWIPTHGRAKAGRPARTYIQQLCEDTGCCPEDLPRAMNDREEWGERVRDIRATSAIWWWWWWWWKVYQAIPVGYHNIDTATWKDKYKNMWIKICRQKMSVLFNQICINGEMLTKYTHPPTHTRTHIYVYQPLHIYIYIYYEKNLLKNLYRYTIYYICIMCKSRNTSRPFKVDGEVLLMLELWGKRSTPLLLSLLSPLWPGEVAPNRVLSMGQIKLNCVLLLNWIVWNRTIFVC